jgi:hypothetical protein
MSNGVVIPQGQRRSGERSAPRKIINAVVAQLVAVEYTDGHGTHIKEFWYKVGDTYYCPPAAEEFANNIKPVLPVYAAQLNERLNQGHSLGLPAEDSVDVVSQQVSRDVGGDVDV